MAINSQYKTYAQVNEDFWREVNVKYDKITENMEQFGDRPVLSLFNELTAQDILDVAEVLGFSLQGEVREKQQESLFNQLTDSDKSDLLFLRDFQNRRKRTIQNYYRAEVKADTKYNSVIVQLLQMLRSNPVYLIEIYTLYIWENRATGDLYTYDKELTIDSVMSLVQDDRVQGRLNTELEKAAKDQHRYRVYSFFKQDKSKLVVLLYKQIGDFTRPDMVKAIRHRDIEHLLFAIDVKDKTLELKLETGYEHTMIKQFIESEYDATLQLIKKEVFKDYTEKSFKQAVLEGGSASGKPVDGLLVTRVCFAESPLKNSPEVTIDTGKVDVWLSVMDAHQRGAISLESLKSLKNLQIHVNGNNRIVRSIVQNNGDVVFDMDDKRLDSVTKEYISEKFREKFGVPLFQPISNEKFQMGQADKIDYIMGRRERTGIDDQSKELFFDLKKEGYVSENQLVDVKCLNPDCDYQEQISEKDVPKVCECGGKLKTEFVFLMQPNLPKIKELVKKTLQSWTNDGEWVLKNDDSKLTVSKQTLSLFLMERKKDGKVFQVHVTDQLMAPKVVAALNKMMTPTLLIFAGQQEKSIERYTTECVKAVNFGRVYYLPEADEKSKKFYSEVFENLELRAKNFMASAANKAYEFILDIVEKGTEGLKAAIGNDRKTGKEYEREFEDSTFAIFKDMLPNAVKWGHEKAGVALPEGTFAITFQQTKGKKTDNKHFAFSYDCKFTKENGYDLERGEQRKALEYVRKLSESDLISAFSDENQLSGHIFVSNTFRKTDYQKMKDYFEENLDDEFDTISIFLRADALAHLHKLYRTNTLELEIDQNLFKQQIYVLLTETKGEITVEHVNKAIEKALDPDRRKTRLLNTRKLTDELS